MFASRTALIAGSTQGLGKALAHRLVANGLDRLVISGRNVERGDAAAAEFISLGCQTVFVRTNLEDSESVEALLAEAEDQFGPVHLLANCAAMTARGTVWDTKPGLFDQMMAINVRAPFQLMQGVARGLREANEPGSIINVGSMAAYGGQPEITAYSASKAALVTLTKTVAYQLMRHHIRVNLVNPGWMDTEGEDATQRRYHGAQDGWLEAAASERPFGRLIRPAELAKTMAFVLSDEAGLMTGSIIDYDQSVIGAGDLGIPPITLGPVGEG